MRPLESCEFWDDTAVKKEERRKSIKETLELVAARLAEISVILEDEE